MKISRKILTNRTLPTDVGDIISSVDLLLCNPLYGFENDFNFQSKQNEIHSRLFSNYSIDEISLIYSNRETYLKDYKESLFDDKGNIYRNPFIRVTKAGAVIDVLERSLNPSSPGVIKIDKEHYINTHRPLSVPFDSEDVPDDVVERNGIYYQKEKFKPAENKTVDDLSKTFKRLRNIINANTEDPSHCLWVTLTYAENIKGAEGNEKLYGDFKRAMTRLRRYTKKEFNCSFEYISVVEPQGRGAWHCHLILIFSDKAPYIPNDVISSCWEQGFTKTTKMNANVDNLGAYLTAYLCDIPLDDVNSDDFTFDMLKDSYVVEKQGKKFIKGGRLYLYPLNMKLYRTSRGIKQPEIEELSREELDKLTEGLVPLSQVSMEVTFENDKKQILRYTHYNKNKNLI